MRLLYQHEPIQARQHSPNIPRAHYLCDKLHISRSTKSNFTTFIDYQQAKALKSHTTFIASLNELNIPHNDPNSTEKTPEPAKFFNCPDLASKCKELTKEHNCAYTLEFLPNFNNWHIASHLNSSDLQKKLELWHLISRHLQIQLSSKIDFNKNNYEEIVKAVNIPIERKHPRKNPILKFISTTKQGPDQSLNEYFHQSHRVAAESGLHDGGWTTHNIESMILGA